MRHKNLMVATRGGFVVFFERKMLFTSFAMRLQKNQIFIILEKTIGAAKLLSPKGIVFVDIDDLEFNSKELKMICQ
jgi:hypothetical protein